MRHPSEGWDLPRLETPAFAGVTELKNERA
jgi:hypothetical protein